jgi:16S rRNA (uracil1498-N3)-methyltransferase
MVIIGPEGDFSPEEVQEARAAGFIPVTLGESRLRTETAGMMAVAWIHALLAKREA